MSDIQINLVCCTQVICDEVAAGCTQNDIALSYAMALKAKMQGADDPDWGVINRSILAKWKMSGLERIKKRAIDIVSGKIAP